MIKQNHGHGAAQGRDDRPGANRWYFPRTGDAPPDPFGYRCLNNPRLDPNRHGIASCGRYNCPLHGWGDRVRRADALLRMVPVGHSCWMTCVHLNRRVSAREVGDSWRLLKKAVTRAVGEDHFLVAVPGYKGVRKGMLPYVHLHVLVCVSPGRTRERGVKKAMSREVTLTFCNGSVKEVVSGGVENSLSHTDLIRSELRSRRHTTPRVSADESGATWARCRDHTALLTYALRARNEDRLGIPPGEQPGSGGRYRCVYWSGARLPVRD